MSGPINNPDLILLWCPIGAAQNTAFSGVVDSSSGYPLLEPYDNPGEHYTNEVGVTILLNTGIDLSNAVLAQIQVQQPGGSIMLWNATIVTVPGVTSIVSGLQYVTQVGDLYYPGTYKVQPLVSFTNWRGLGETGTFQINMPYDQLGEWA